MIQMFIKHYWAAAILGLLATVGWFIQGLGNAYYYRQASQHLPFIPTQFIIRP
ncbi:hypothetical protein L208DRAFT_1387304 [Tricholoma matsutake]|nr:hypothetical protein L208DRAFT_1387304 [Tricholoma matsutake 945]